MIERTTASIIQMIEFDIKRIHLAIQNLAPENSKYVSYDNGKLVNYIYVNNRKVTTNTGNLKSNVQLKSMSGNNRIDYTISVDGSAVPYYERAVLSPTLTRARHYGRTEYGSKRYSKSVEQQVENRNYMYYMKALGEVQSIISGLNGSVYYVKDDIGVYE